MRSKYWLITLVVVLSVVAAAEGFLLWKANSNAANAKQVTSPYAWHGVQPSKQVAPALPTVTMNIHRGWNDPFAGVDQDSWDPFREMDAMQSMMNRMFRDTYNRGMKNWGAAHSMVSSYDPQVDFKALDKEYVVTVDLPGIDKDKIDIKVHDHQLTLSGQRESEKQQTNDQGGYYSMERSFGSFMRSIPLPADAGEEGIVADSKNGVLTIRIPRIAVSTGGSKKVSVQ